MKYKKYFPVLFVLLVLLFSGCIFFSGDISSSYPEQSVKLSYKISYGYRLNCTGNGIYKIIYDCDEPEVLYGYGSANIENVLNEDYTDKKNIASFNDMKSWNISKSGVCSNYELGLSATVDSETMLVNDLNGAKALSLSEIKNNYPQLVDRYCRPQGNKTIIFIDPDNPEIHKEANDIYEKAGTDNSFVIAKKLFTWLKENTGYKTHYNENLAQPADLTMNIKTGDCDDLTYLYLSMCKSLDIPCRFIRGFLIYENKAEPHAWAEVFVGGNIGDNGWIPVECAGYRENDQEIEIEIHQNFALESADHLRLFKDDGTNDSINISLTGISYMSGQNVKFETPDFFTEIEDYNVISSKKLHIDENNFRSYK